MQTGMKQCAFRFPGPALSNYACGVILSQRLDTSDTWLNTAIFLRPTPDAGEQQVGWQMFKKYTDN